MSIYKYKYLLSFMFVVSICLLSFGCGSMASRPETQTEVLGPTPQAERLEKFNGQLAAINDAPTAKTAITTFADYVEGSPSKAGTSASSVRIFSASLIDRLAGLEAKARKNIQGGLTVAASASTEGIATVDKVTEALNAAKDPSLPAIKASEVEFIQAGIRSEIPDIVPGPPTVFASSAGDSTEEGYHAPNQKLASPYITPIEAMVIGYVIASGDDGSAGPGANKDKLPPTKVETFLDGVTK